ncbi:MAG TPA: hypothetical protein VNF26_07820 [Candidatus Baltobacterales bacterium]|nr:hypothetical protein [Candidatus Baltobacterales bacterium]
METGLCVTCRHSRRVPGSRSTFWMCERSLTDRSFPRYPKLPVLRCRGFEPDPVKPPPPPS